MESQQRVDAQRLQPADSDTPEVPFVGTRQSALGNQADQTDGRSGTPKQRTRYSRQVASDFAGTVRSVEDLRSVITEWAAHPIFTCVDDRLLCRVCVVGGRDFGCCSRAVVVGGLGQSRAATAWN